MSVEPDSYPELIPYVLIMMSLISFECLLISIFITGAARRKSFNKDYLTTFSTIHSDAFENLNVQTDSGYPDNGSGRYSKELSYKGWYDLNNGQRVHYNFVE